MTAGFYCPNVTLGHSSRPNVTFARKKSEVAA